ncbi:MAG: NfeD family protein [Lachnospiraceae bacterium]|nr:NfeD family protein [Lachnospiraceae bacterium]MCR5081899.1 NfeD family protein [Parasporobacterium sp.]
MAWIVWLIIAVALAVIELVTINLVCVWFVVSAVAAIFVSLATDSIVIQLAVFVIAGVVLMLLTRPMLMKRLGKSNEKTNLDRVVGMQGIVTENIEPLKVGEVKVDGKLWSAVSDILIEKDEVVEIVSIDGVKLNVKKAE